MSVRHVAPTEARELMEKEGFTYVDVRSVPEFQAGHPAGAFNVPLLDVGPMGMAPNPGFLGAMEKLFAKDAPLVIGCKAGGRSAQAAGLLERAGWTKLVDLSAGFDGNFGEAGWQARGLPVSREAEPGRSWDEVQKK